MFASTLLVKNNRKLYNQAIQRVSELSTVHTVVCRSFTTSFYLPFILWETLKCQTPQSLQKSMGMSCNWKYFLLP